MPTIRFLVALATTIIASTVNALPYADAPYSYTASGFRPSPTGFPSPHFNSTSNSTANTTSILPDVIRGVNIGGWLILEQWMNSDVFTGTNATDQFSFDQTLNATAKLHDHWSTFFTENDVKTIASYGINALRIPIGYWAYDHSNTSYITGADAYLEQAILWARAAGLVVLVDCHGSPGSQNGFDNSGRAGEVAWQDDHNLNKSISILQTMARKYGAKEYADVVYAIELVNEPISWDQNNFDKTQRWAQQAYHAVKAASTNKALMVIMHDAFMGPSQWETVGAAVNGNATKDKAHFALDVHLYQNQEAADSLLTQAGHITKACNWTQSQLLPANSSLPVFVGEFSAATNICANPNGTTLAGSTCYTDGCQCSSNVPIQYWQQPLVDATRRFMEAEMDVFERSARGWFLWAYKGPGAWGLDNLVKYGAVGKSVTERKFPGQCALGH